MTLVALLWLANMGVKLCFDSWSDAGTFGDQFGAVNALFSGLAFIGLIYTIIQQTESIQQQTKSLNQHRAHCGRLSASTYRYH